MVKYLYLFGTLFFTIYGQVILKWRLNSWAQIPESLNEKIRFIIKALTDPFILSGFFSAFAASICWMLAMTKFEITQAYPIMTLAPALIFFIGIYAFGETFTWGKVIGLVLISIGTIVTIKF